MGSWRRRSRCSSASSSSCSPTTALDTLNSQGGVGLLVFTGVSLTFSLLTESTQRARSRTRELLVGAQNLARERATLYDAEKESREELERTLVRLDLLQGLTAALSEAATPVQVAEALVQRMLTMGAAELCTFYAYDARAERLVVLAHAGAEASFNPPLPHMNVAAADDDPVRKLVTSRQPMWIEDRQRYRELFGREPSSPYGFEPNAFVILPLDAPGGRLHGILLLAYRTSRAFGAEFRQLLTVVSRQAAQAVDRSRLFDAEHRTRERVSRLAEVAEVVNAQLDRDATFHALGRWLVPNLADWCALQAPGEPPLIFRATEGGIVAETTEMASSGDVDARAALERVLGGGAPELYPAERRSSGDITGAATAAPASLAGLASAIVVPLSSRGKRLAALVVGITSPDSIYDADDLHMFEQIASRAAVAAENATLFQEARAAVRYRDEFLSIASHELNTPLTPLRLQLESALRGVVEERLRGKLTLSVKQVDRISKLVGELLDVSRITSGKLHLREESIDLADLLREVTEAHQSELTRAGCELHLTSSGPIMGTYDRLRLSQVVANLLSNAAKYGAGKPVDIALTASADSAVLTVADRGIGIPVKDQERIFERFERAASARNYGGFGLGLFIAKQIVEASGGRVRAEIREGGGTTFTVTLPRRVVAATGSEIEIN